MVGKQPGAEHVVVLCGFSGHGFKFAPLMGDIAADLVIDGKTEHSIDHLSLARS